MHNTALDVRKYEGSPAMLTQTHNIPIQDTSYVTIEYRPRNWVLDDYDSFIDILDELEFDHPEKAIVDLYHILSKALYPGHSDRDQPWQVIPMVVSVEYGPSSVILGSM